MINIVKTNGVAEISSSLHHNHNKKEAAEAVNIRQQSNGVKLTKINSSH
jgi:hypothetical protein